MPGRSRKQPGPGRLDRALGLLLTLLLSATVSAQTPLGEIEAGGIYYDVSDNLGDTAGAYARARTGPIGRDEWRAEVVQLERFDDDGVFGAVGNIHHFNERWSSDLAIGSSAGGFFWPELRIDATLSRRWLADRRFITTAGITYFDAKDIHTDVGYRIEGTYYTGSPWVLQGGVTYNVSEPGAVGSVSGFGVVQHVTPRERIISLRLGGGEQAYQPFADDDFLVDVRFFTARLTLRQWIGTSWGINVVTESYVSGTYDQHGVEFGIFREF